MFHFKMSFAEYITLMVKVGTLGGRFWVKLGIVN